MKNFENYLRLQHMKERPEILDDDLSDNFETWLAEKDGDEIVEYAENMAKDICRPDCGYCNAVYGVGEDKI